MQAKEPEEEEQSEEEEVWVEDERQQAPAMMVTLLRNFNRHRAVQITLVFDPENKHRCNGRVPVTDLTIRLATQTDVPVCK